MFEAQMEALVKVLGSVLVLPDQVLHPGSLSNHSMWWVVPAFNPSTQEAKDIQGYIVRAWLPNLLTFRDTIIPF